MSSIPSRSTACRWTSSAAKSELTYTLNVLSNHTVEFTFAEGEATDGGGSNTGLIISVVVIVLVLAGGGVLFYLKWRQSRF